MRADDRGILGLPVKMAVAMVIVVTMAPLLLGMVQTAEDSMTVLTAESEAKRIADGMTRAYYGGVGTEETVLVTIPVGESVEMGGSGTDAYVIRVMDPYGNVTRLYAGTPSIPVIGDAVSITGEAAVRITCAVVDGVYGVTVSA